VVNFCGLNGNSSFIENATSKITIALTWCLAWGNQRQPQYSFDILNQAREALNSKQDVPTEIQDIVQQVQT
jgi:CRISPR-associated protein Cmr2